jgi:hypothetical protein
MPAARTSTFRISRDSRIPGPDSGAATTEDYDRFFKLKRDATGLREWTTDCLSLSQRLLEDLDGAGLSERDQNRILEGLVVLYRATLERWCRGGGELA